MRPFAKVEKFLLQFCPSSDPLLLALSGGPDSLYLFYSLLFFRKKHGIPFHIAHVDHGWRVESLGEAQALQALAELHHVPFHLKILNSALLKGNLEAACREERYVFFAELASKTSFQAVLTGHHQDDQAETVFKRLLEGAHWSNWKGLQAESWMKGVRILRPLLGIEKSEIQKMLLEHKIFAFDDPTNRHVKFLRARLRQSIFPRLNQEFGKEVQKSMALVAQQSQELVDYFEERLSPLLLRVKRGPFGAWLDLQQCMPRSLVEIKFLLRMFSREEGVCLSREMIDQAATALLLGKANHSSIMGSQHVWIDRNQIFIPKPRSIETEKERIHLSPGKTIWSRWALEVVEEQYDNLQPISSWKEGWMGHIRGYLPMGNYRLGFTNSLENAGMKKRWNQAKVPAFLYYVFPFIWQKEEISYEFLSGKPLLQLENGSPCWKVELTYNDL